MEYINVAYKGANYMVVPGSPRARLLREANTAWRMGYEGLNRELFTKAVNASGCAFQHRQGVRA
jgi:hypothetical protein